MFSHSETSWVGLREGLETPPALHGNDLRAEAYAVAAAFGYQFIRDVDDLRTAFREVLLDGILAFSASEYGFVAEVQTDEDGQPYLKTVGHALTDISWNAETRDFYQQHVAAGMEFRNLNTLFGQVLLTGAPVISNDPEHDPRRGGLPYGHPALRSFLGFPIHLEGDMIGVIGIANRAGGYDAEILQALVPIELVVGTAIIGMRARRAKADAESAIVAALEEQNAQLRRLDEMKDTFVSSVSHELRTPLTAVLVYAEELAKAGDAGVSDSGAAIVRNTKRLLTLTDDILMMSSQGLVRFDIQRSRQHVPTLVKRIIDENHSVYRDTIFNFRSSSRSGASSYMQLDPERVQQAVSNLIRNAIRFSDVAGVVSITSTIGRKEWIIEVCDEGLGIPQGELERVREPFFRASNASQRSVRGAGLGLHVVDLIMQAHGGSMCIESTVGKGTCVTLTFPRESAMEA